MRNFYQWLAEEMEVVPGPPDEQAGDPYEIMAQQAIQHPQDHTKGPMGDIADFAAVLSAATKGYPQGSKQIAALGVSDNSLVPHMNDNSDPFISHLMTHANQLMQAGKLSMQKDGEHGLLVGNPQRIQEFKNFFNSRQQGWEQSADYHRAFGRFMGYSDQAINAFLQKLRLA
jgi:hypothetical protein